MKSAHYGKSSKKQTKHFAGGYYRKENGQLEVKFFNQTQGFQEPNGGVKATIGDMVKFMNFLRFYDKFKYHKNVLQKSVLQKYFFNLHKNQKSSYSIQYENKHVVKAYLSGFDFYQEKANKLTHIGHTGQVEYLISNFHFRQDQPFGIIVMYNTSSHKTQNEVTGNYLLRVATQSVISNYKNKNVRMDWGVIKKWFSKFN